MEFNNYCTAKLFEINGVTGNTGNIFWGAPDKTVIPFKLSLKNITKETLADSLVTVSVINMENESNISGEEFTIASVRPDESVEKSIELSKIQSYGTFLITVKLVNGENEMNDFFKVAKVQQVNKQNDIIGVNAHIACHAVDEQEKRMLKTLDMIKAAGFKWVAEDFIWELCEREKGKIEIPDFYEKYISACEERGLKIQMNLKLKNPLYGNKHSDDPEYLEAVGNFYRALAKKFKGRIGSWDAEGEIDYQYGYTYAEYPNNDYTPEQFAGLMKVVYEAIKGEDQDTVVTYGSLLRNSYAWLQRLLSAGGGDYSDAIAIHPYTYPHTPYGDVTTWLERCEKISEKHKAKRTVVRISELGWSTATDNSENLGCTEIEQAAYAMQAYLVCKQNGNVEFVSYYDICNDGTDYEEMEHKFGILDGMSEKFRTPFMVKPAYCVMPTIANQLTGIVFEEELYFDIWLIGLKFKTADGKHLVALWSRAGRDKSIEIKTEGLGGKIKWFDIFGNENTVANGEKSFTFELSICPKFIVCDEMSEQWKNQPQLSLHRTNHLVKSTHHRPV